MLIISLYHRLKLYLYPHYSSIIHNVYTVPLLFTLLASLGFSEQPMQPGIPQEGRGMAVDVTQPQRRPNQEELKRIKELGGEVLIDGSVRITEPIYGKNLDLVEISTSVTPVANHARLFIVAQGTFTVLKIQFDNGQINTITNN